MSFFDESERRLSKLHDEALEDEVRQLERKVADLERRVVYEKMLARLGLALLSVTHSLWAKRQRKLVQISSGVAYGFLVKYLEEQLPKLPSRF